MATQNEEPKKEKLCTKCGGIRRLASILIMNASDKEAEAYLAQFDQCEKCGQYLAKPDVGGSVTFLF